MELQITPPPPAYTIEETNFERQHLLAKLLAPVSLKALENISLKQNATILDLGCGLGDTTLMLQKRFPGATITGLDGDAALIEVARDEKKFHSNLHFVSNDALQLPFDDNSFDLVFCRYTLQHVPDPFAVMLEMKRVCRHGGIVFAQEPDANFMESYPPSNAYPQFIKIAGKLFTDAILGRKLIYYFRRLGLKNIMHDAQSILADHNNVLKKFYRITTQAMSKAILQKDLLTKKQLDGLIGEMEKIENDEETIVLTHAIIAVWGIK